MKVPSYIKNVKLSAFAPIDRESIIVEVEFNNDIIFDISKNEDNGKFEILFHKMENMNMGIEQFNEVVKSCIKLIDDDLSF